MIACIESYIPTLPEYIEQANHFKYIFNNGPRIIIASTIAFILGGVINIDIIASKNIKNTFSFFIKVFLAGLVGQFMVFESICIIPLAKPVIAFIKKCE